MKKATAHRILRAALDVFTTEGFAGTTAQIAHAAGVGPGTLFRYFPTKAGLTAALFQEVEQGLEKELVPGLPHPTPPAWLTNAAQSRLLQYWMQAAQQALRYPAAFQYWVHYLLTRPPLPTAEPAPAVLERAFRSWWRGLDL